MSGKYAFTKSLKEVRFHFCQTSAHSASARYGNRSTTLIFCCTYPSWLTLDR